jgi:hypothetical protein
MPRRELIAQLRPPRLTHEHLDQRLIVVRIGQHHFIDVARHGRFVRHGRVAIGRGGCRTTIRLVVGVGGRLFVHVDVFVVDAFAGAREAVGVDDVVPFVGDAVFERGVGEAVEAVWVLRRFRCVGSEEEVRTSRWDTCGSTCCIS